MSEPDRISASGGGGRGTRIGKMSHTERRVWLVVQWALLAAGALVIVLLMVRPAIGLIVLWDVLIAVAPALLVFAPGLWRNICPLGTVSQLGRGVRVGWRRHLPSQAHAWLSLGSVGLLLVLVPARHLGLDDTGIATATLLVLLGACALASGFILDGKSGWCSGLCPVHPVEQLYGSRPAITLRNAHCTECVRCVVPCPDSTAAMNPVKSRIIRSQTLAGLILVGGFPGFVLGWYETPAAGHLTGVGQTLNAVGWTWGLMAVSAVAFFTLRAALGVRALPALIRVFAAAAVSLYYWYKLPSLLGLSGSGTVLVDLDSVLPGWTLWALRSITTAIFVWWLVPARLLYSPRPWLHRPPFAPSLAPITVSVSAGRSRP